jgi:hypothetical protein
VLNKSVPFRPLDWALQPHLIPFNPRQMRVTVHITSLLATIVCTKVSVGQTANLVLAPPFAAFMNEILNERLDYISRLHRILHAPRD